MDVGKLLQDNAGVVGAVVGFVASQVIQIWRDQQTEERAIARELHADKRAQRDAKLVRMRAAFQPALLAAWGLQTAGVDVRHSSKSSSEEARQELLADAMKGLNEARAQLLMESDVRDVFDELERVRAAYENLVLTTYDQYGPAPSEELDKDWSAIKEGLAKIEKLIDDHLRAVERSAV